MKWQMQEPGWYVLFNDDFCPPSLAAVCLDKVGKGIKWCVYVERDMLPGDSQHATLALAKKAAERKVRRAKR